MRFRDQYKQVDPKAILIDPGHNVRNYELSDNQDNMARLKQSIKDNGVQQALWVREMTQDEQKQYEAELFLYVLVDGESRLRNVLALLDEGTPIDKVPVKLLDDMDPAMLKLRSLQANTGKQLQPWEAGVAYLQLENYGWDREKIAAEVGQTLQYVNQAIELSTAPEEVKIMLAKEEISVRLALIELRDKGQNSTPALQQAVVQAKAEGKSQALAPRMDRVKLYDKFFTELFDITGPDYAAGKDVTLTNAQATELFRLAGLVK
jgi:ParB-like chromosome segregation protein Spo0J